MKRSARLLAICSMLTAMTCIATMIIRVPTIGTGGYVNIGDAFVLVSAWMLGNPWGAVAAGAGSALADILSGYAVYAPATAAIKFAMAFACSVVFTATGKRNVHRFVSFALGSLVAEVIMVAGYFVYESTVMGYGSAAFASVISNIVQGAVCLVIGNALVQIMSGIRAVNDLRTG